MSERSFYIVVYDIVNDKRRTKVARYLESIGSRVQYSVFEIYLTKAEIEKMLQILKKLILEREDGIRVYSLCETCRPKITTIGLEQVTTPPGVTII